MEQKNSALQTQGLNVPAIGREEQQFAVAVTTGKIIASCSVEEIKQVLRLVIIKVGVREQNWPNDIEKLLLIEHLVSNFGGNRLEEIKLAFDMAINGRLDVEVNCFENFSVLYITKILNAYRFWAEEQYRVIEPKLPPIDDSKYLQPAIPPETHWGKFIEQEYQHFLSFGDEHWKIFPVDFYNQLVKDNLLNEHIYRQAMPIVRKRIIGSLLRDKVKHQMASTRSHDKNRVEFVKSIQKTNISDIDRKIQQYELGEKDSEIEVIAKQFCVLQYFKKAKHEGKNNIYQPVTE